MHPDSVRILLIEDNPGDARLLEVLLSEVVADRSIQPTFHLKCVESLKSGLEHLNNGDFDVTLLDLSLPDSHGFETFSKAQASAPKMPIIVLSGLDDSTVAIEAVRQGAQDYLVKGQVTGSLLWRAMRYAVERKKSEEALKQMNEKLKKLDQLKSDFISTVSHELRTPIAIMREGVSLCLDGVAGAISETQRELLTDTKQNIDRLTRLVTDLLDISKIEAGKIRLRRSAVDICELARKTLSGYENQAKEKGITLEMHVPEETLKIYVDADKITQIFNNLINNSLRFTQSGGEISVGVEDEGGKVRCSVRDTGIGISEENQSKLFSKFEQVGRVDGPGYKGTGLGLAICKGLVNKHGGKIWVESKMGQGATFRFTLKKIPFPKILVVDDEEKIVEVIKEFLMPENFRVIEAYNGNEAIEKAYSENPSLILLDMKLPEMNGYEVVGRLKHDTRTHKIPLIIISAFSVDKSRLEQDMHSAFPVIKKPFEREVLLNHIYEMLTK